jgi:hypothetical protein
MIDIKIIDDIQANIERDLMSGIERATNKALNHLALQAQSYAVQAILQGPKTGRIYKRGAVSHRASAPGEAPANDLGFLAQSLRIQVTDRNTVNLSALAPYAVHLEYGTRNMAPRPFLRPAGEKAGRNSKEVFTAYIKAELR